MLWVMIVVGLLVVVGVGVGIATAPKQRDLAEAEAELRRRTGLSSVEGAMGTSLVARRELGTLRYEHSSRREGSKDVSVGYWRLEPQPPLKVGLQLIERRLVPRSTAARAAIALGDAAFGTKRVVAIRYAGPRPIGEPALD